MSFPTGFFSLLSACELVTAQPILHPDTAGAARWSSPLTWGPGFVNATLFSPH